MSPTSSHKQILHCPAFIVFVCLFWCLPHIAQAHELTIAYYSDKPPYQYTTAEGKADGLIIDFWRLWSKTNHITVNFVATEPGQSLVLLKSGEVDAHAGMAVDMSNDPNLYQGVPIYESKAIIFTDINLKYSGALEELSAFQVGVIQKESTGAYLQNALHKTAIIPFSDYPQLIDAVANGRIKVFVADALTSFFHLNKKSILNSFYYNRVESLFTTK